ncbi:hypothetical protein LguiB_007709 [Lonicera macranthoides]
MAGGRSSKWFHANYQEGKKAKARVENPIKGCTALLASLEQKVEELQERVGSPGSAYASPALTSIKTTGSLDLFHHQIRRKLGGHGAYPFSTF